MILMECQQKKKLLKSQVYVFFSSNKPLLFFTGNLTYAVNTILVELETGTGAVHTAPSYGKEDYLCGIKNGLDIIVTVDSKGVQRGEESGPFKDTYI